MHIFLNSALRSLMSSSDRGKLDELSAKLA